MLSLLLRNLFFTIIQPGIVAGLIPYLILRDEVNSLFTQPLQLHHYAGTIICNWFSDHVKLHHKFCN